MNYKNKRKKQIEFSENMVFYGFLGFILVILLLLIKN